MRRPPTGRRTTYIITAVLIVAFASGFALAAGLTITNGAAENGSGVYNGASGTVNWWSEFSVGGTTVPSGLATLSAAVAAPTLLAGASSSYAVNAPMAGDIATFWKLQETTAATLNTELELVFQVLTGGGGGTLTSFTLFVKTQASAPGATLTFTIYDDLGAGSTGPIIQSVVVIWQQCAAVGNCP